MAWLAGALTGRALVSWPAGPLSVTRVVLLTCEPLLLAAWLASVGHGPSDPVVPNYRADLDIYRGGCLEGTDYGGRAAQHVYLTPGVVTVEPMHGQPLRFAETGYSWPSPGRAELGGVGVAPADSITRTTLAALGCP
jgi:hypothetical protein